MDTTPTWDNVTARMGRNDLPHALAEHFDDLAPTEQVKAVMQSWMMAEYPLSHLDADEWTSFFTEVGFTADGKAADPREFFDTETIILYRGCDPVNDAGMSWTTDIDQARWFANRWSNGNARVITFQCPTKYALAYIGVRGESEVVVEIEALLTDMDIDFNVAGSPK